MNSEVFRKTYWIKKTMANWFLAGWPLNAIAERQGVSRQRVHQQLKKYYKYFKPREYASETLIRVCKRCGIEESLETKRWLLKDELKLSRIIKRKFICPLCQSLNYCTKCKSLGYFRIYTNNRCASCNAEHFHNFYIKNRAEVRLYQKKYYRGKKNERH